MLPPLEYSMSVWWFATPLWESEDSALDDSASYVVDALIPLIEQATLSDSLAPANASLAAQPSVAPIEAAPAPPHAPARLVLKGYAWSARPAWVAHLGPLWEGLVDIRRHDSARHHEQREVGFEPVLGKASSPARP